MPIAPGDRFGHYEVLAPLGAGGMGEVYRARDSRLGRDVALKVLPSHAAGDPQLRERFVREAQIVSSLGHPHICTLHDVGSEGTASYLVMELLDGETLAKRLERGPLKLEVALRTAAEIASGLDRAHRAGVVHRDLKPSNVMLTRGGAKILDFGIAKIAESGKDPSSAGAFPTALPTRTTPLTTSGSILGTLSYMAPEQLEGKEIDSRADLFSFGAVLHEMVTGRRAFEGKSQASVIAAVLERDPPPASSLAPGVPAAVDRIIRECLAKDPDERRQSAHDLASDLRGLADGSLTGPHPQARPRRSVASALPWALAALGLLAGILPYALRSKAPEAPVVEASETLAEANEDLGWPAVSPDGSAVAYVDYTPGQETKIRVRRIDDATPRILEGTDGAARPFWSPTGREIGYFTSGSLWALPIAGGRPREVCPAGYGAGGVWLADGTIVFARSFNVGLQRVDARGGAPQPLTTLDPLQRETGHLWPVEVPGARFVLFLSRTVASKSNRIETVSLEDGKRTVVAEADSLVGYAAPWLLFVRAGVLLAQPFSAKSGGLTGEPKTLLDNVFFGEGWAASQASVAGDLLAWTPARSIPVRAEWLDQGSTRAPVFEEKDVSAIRFSPDGSHLAYTKRDHARGSDDLWVIDLARSVRTRLTTTRGDESYLAWLPSGDEILYSSDDEGTYSLRRVAADGSLPSREVLTETSADWFRPSVCPDGRTVFAARQNIDAPSDLWRFDLAAPDKREPWLASESVETAAACSPDGEWVAFQSTRAGVTETYVRRASGGPVVQLSVGGAGSPRWSPDGKSVLFSSLDGYRKRVALRFDAGRAFPGPPVDLPGSNASDILAWDVAPDGRILTLRRTEENRDSLRLLVGWKRRLR